MRKTEEENCHRDGDLMQKLFFFFVFFSCMHLKPECTLEQIPAAIVRPLKASTASGNSMCHYGLVKAITGKNITVGHEK